MKNRRRTGFLALGLFVLVLAIINVQGGGVLAQTLPATRATPTVSVPPLFKQNKEFRLRGWFVHKPDIPGTMNDFLVAWIKVGQTDIPTLVPNSITTVGIGNHRSLEYKEYTSGGFIELSCQASQLPSTIELPIEPETIKRVRAGCRSTGYTQPTQATPILGPMTPQPNATSAIR